MIPFIPSLFGLFVANMTNISIPLTGVHYDVNIKSFASRITINQTYKNVESTDLECVYGFPINDKAAIVGLTVTIGNRTLISQFKRKDEAFKEYTNALTRGDGAYVLDQSDRSDDTFVLSVGRLPPGKECTVSIAYVGTLDSVSETLMRLVIPTSLYPRFSPVPQAPKGVAPPEKYQENVTYKATLLGHIKSSGVILNVTSPTHPLDVINAGPKEAWVKFADGEQPLDRDLFIDINLQTNPQQYVEVERTADGKYAAMYAFVPHFTKKEGGLVNSELIFVVDCSGSMYSDDKIGDAKRAMQIFLRSIPEGTYFNFYVFGSRFRSLFPKSVIYSADSFAKAKEYADQTDANMGGTEILQPLMKIYADQPLFGFSRQIFLLTDGEVTNTDEVVALVRSNAANTRMFSFGLGQSPSRSLVNGVAAAGNGKAEFIKHGQELDSIIARQLNRALQPAVTDAVVTWHGVKNVQQVPTALPAVFRGDRQLLYAFFDMDEAATSSPYVELSRGESRTKIELEIPSSGLKTAEKPILEKLAARELIKQVENSAPPPKRYGYRGSLQNRAPLPTNEDIKAKVTDLSLKYGVLSRYVSLIAVETRSQEERDKMSPDMKLREVPVQLAEVKRPSQPRPWRPFRFRRPIWGGGMKMAMGSVGGRFRKGGGFRSYRPTSLWSRPSIVTSNSNQPSSTVTSPLSQLLALQQWNGAWKFSSDLDKLTDTKKSEVLEKVAAVRGELSDDVVATILAMTFIEETYPEKADMWQAIVRKAATFLAKQSDDPAVAGVKKELQGLMKSKKVAGKIH